MFCFALILIVSTLFIHWFLERTKMFIHTISKLKYKGSDDFDSHIKKQIMKG